MRIGIDIRTLLDKQYSGVSLHTLYLIREILRADTKNEYKLFYNSFYDLSDRLPKFDGENVEIIKTSYPNKIFNYGLQKIFSSPKLDEILGGVDVFWSPHINFTNLSHGCGKILTVHDLSFLRYGEYFDFKKKIWHWGVNAMKLIKDADRIIAVSENTKNDIIELCQVPSEKIEVSYLGVEEKYFIKPDSVDLDRVKIKYNLPDKFIFYLGNLEPRKNIAGLITAYGKFRSDNGKFSDYKLAIAGGAGWKVSKIMNAISDSDYKQDIILLDYVDDADKSVLYRLATLFVYPSFYEGFGLPPLEAMACGLPVIASNSSSLNEVIGNAGLIVDPNNLNEIAYAISIVLRNEDLRTKMSESGIKKAATFSWKKTAEIYLRSIRQVG